MEKKMHHEKGGAMNQQAKPIEGKCCCKGMKGIAGIATLLAVGVLIGVLIGYASVGGQKECKAQSCKCPVVEKPAVVDVAGMKSKVSKYLEDNIFAGSGITVGVESAEALGTAYNLSVTLTQDGQNQGGGVVIVSGDTLVLPQMVVDMNAPVEQPAAEPVATEVPKTDKPKVELFIMSFCPYGVQAAGVMEEPAALLGSKIDLKLNYVLYSNYASQRGGVWSDYCFDEAETYCSMHGINELKEDIRQLCIQKNQGDKLWAYMSQVIAAYNAGNVSASNIEAKWKGFAQAAGINVAQVESCVNSEAETLLAEQAALNDIYGVQGSPTLIINGAKAQLSRTPEAFKTGICDAFNTAPAECQQALSSGGAAAAGNC